VFRKLKEKAESAVNKALDKKQMKKRAPGMPQDKVIEMANTIKVSEIAKLVQ
jgi:hypothetical protein